MRTWLWIAAGYGVMSVAAFVLYWQDKRAASHGAWRVRERTLHAMDLLGGWPGAMAAQRVLRHKTRDAKFQLVFWGIVALHAAGWAWWLARA